MTYEAMTISKAAVAAMAPHNSPDARAAARAEPVWPSAHQDISAPGLLYADLGDQQGMAAGAAKRTDATPGVVEPAPDADLSPSRRRHRRALGSVARRLNGPELLLPGSRELRRPAGEPKVPLVML
jgi:hypothetical protein